MSILSLGLSHEEAPVELRERLAIPRPLLESALDSLSSYVPEGVILSTCNRIEVYATVGHHDSGLRSLTRFMADWCGMAESDLEAYLRSHWQEDAIRHLFRVAAGLNSMMLGEGQILSQVRQAYEAAAKQRPLGAVLARLFDRALAVGKRARTETGIARNAVSISQAAVEQASVALGGLRGATVVVIGTGKMGELAGRMLRDRGASRLLLLNRTLERASVLSESVGGEAWSLDRLGEAIQAADIVISSTSAKEYVLRAADHAELIEARAGRPLAIVDIAVPRDVDPAIGVLPGVHLFNVDSLRDVCAANLEQRRREADKVEAIVEDELAKYLRWWQSRELAPTISALVQQAERIRQDEVSRALGKLGPLSDREMNAVNALTVAIVNKMLHRPITRLKEQGNGLDGKHYVTAVRELFDLPVAEVGAE